MTEFVDDPPTECDARTDPLDFSIVLGGALFVLTLGPRAWLTTTSNLARREDDVRWVGLRRR